MDGPGGSPPITRGQDDLSWPNWISIIVIVIVLGTFFSLGIVKVIDAIQKDNKFKRERILVKICTDGTRIYDWNGKNFTNSIEPVTSDLVKLCK